VINARQRQMYLREIDYNLSLIEALKHSIIVDIRENKRLRIAKSVVTTSTSKKIYAAAIRNNIARIKDARINISRCKKVVRSNRKTLGHK